MKRRPKTPQQKAIEYIIPLWDKEYDVVSQREKILKDPIIYRMGLNESELDKYLLESYESSKKMLQGAKLADTVDRVGSLISIPLEGLALTLGGLPAIPLTAIEEAVELCFKAPVLYNIAKENGYEALKLCAIETLSFVPFAGNIIDIGTNIYVDSAYKIIREKAKEKIIYDRKAPIATLEEKVA